MWLTHGVDNMIKLMKDIFNDKTTSLSRLTIFL